jgi:hypothetical protein
MEELLVKSAGLSANPLLENFKAIMGCPQQVHCGKSYAGRESKRAA